MADLAALVPPVVAAAAFIGIVVAIKRHAQREADEDHRSDASG